MTIEERESKIEELVQFFIDQKDGMLTSREIWEFRQIMERRTPAAPRVTECGLESAYSIAADYTNDKEIECGACGCFGRQAEHFFVTESEPACNEWLRGSGK